MATMERLQKSLESLKNIVKSSQPSDTRKKEKMHLCHIITEAVSNPIIKVSPSFNVILGVTIETFLGLCDDPESDVRMISDECLNRIIRIVSDSHIGKIQIELHKEIKKNGSPRSLRAALVRFSQLAHLIRPHKGKAYVTNLFPSIIKICDRTEESIHEALASAFSRIIQVLGCFAPESETKVLLKAFLKNITKSSTVIRRTSTSCILNICLSSKRPYAYVSYCIDSLLDLLLPLDDTTNETTVLGVLGCLKTLLPQLNETDFSSSNIGYTKELQIQTVPVYKLLQIYEMCIIYLKNKNHNIVIAAFETLNMLLTNANEELKKVLLSPNGIEKSRVNRTNILTSHPRSPSVLSVSTNVTANEDSLFSECELTETIETDIEKWINDSKLTMLNSPITVTSSKSVSMDTLTDNSDKNFKMTDFSVSNAPDSNLPNTRKSDSLENLEKSSENSSEKSYSVAGIDSEGIQEIDIGDLLDKSVPLLFCSRLIVKSFLLYGVPKKYINDKTVRVSVKSSAINCLTSIFRLYPAGFYKFLDKSYVDKPPFEDQTKSGENNKISSQSITDITLFSDHSDPQLRGAVSTLVADLFVAILKNCNNDIENWFAENVSIRSEFASYFPLLSILEKCLRDENSNCLKQTLTSLNPILNMLANSSCCEDVSGIFERLPLLASNPYWLVKVSLCEFVSQLCYTTIFNITGNGNFQNRIIHNVLFELLKDSDQRIRSAAAGAFVEIIGNLYYPEFQPKESRIALKAKEHCKTYLKGLQEKELEYNINKKHFIKNMPTPYSKIPQKSSSRIEFNLSNIVSKLYVCVLESSSKHFVAGCMETLSLLSNRYPPTVYKKSWNSRENQKPDLEVRSNDILDILSLCISLLTSSNHVFDVQFQISVLNLAGNLYAGYSISKLLPVREAENPLLWNMFSNRSLQNLSENLLGFIMKLLHIFHTVLNDIVPVSPALKIALPHLSTTNTISPIKRQISNVEKKSPSLGKIQDKDERTDKKESKNTELSSFVGSQHYMKIYGVLKSSFINYKISLDPQASEKFVELLNTLLHCLSIILEVASLNEFGRISEEMLLYLKSTFALHSVATVQCVQQLLKCLFGTNLACSTADILEEYHSDSKKSSTFGLYHKVFEKPCNKITTSINLFKSNSKIEFEGDNTVMGFLRRRDIKKPSVITKVTSDRTLASYIRIFEPIVIKSLKLYTLTSNVRLQSQVLQLLSQLVQLRVNYCLLDSEQVFKDFVLKHFEFIEEGQIRYSEELLSKIFQFLVQLSYSKQHSKSIIEIPKIIQLCDGLMASGQSPETHCIPALEPIIEDVFLVRNKSNTVDLKELETTRDVVFSMLLRLFEYKEVIDLLTLTLEDCKFCTDSSEKWLRWSSQAFNVFLALLQQNKIRIDDTDAFVSLKKFVFSLHPDVLSSADDVIVMLFQATPQVADPVTTQRWLSKTIILLLILLPLKEEDLLSSINKLKADFNPGSIFENFTPSADPLNVHNNADIFEKIAAEKIVARMILKVVSVVSSRILQLEKWHGDEFLVGQFSVFLMCCTNIFQTGSHCKISKTSIALLQNESELKDSELNLGKINDTFFRIRKIYPTITLHWWYVLTLLNFNDFDFWKSVTYTHSDYKEINHCIMVQGGITILSEFLTETSTNKNPLLFWFLSEGSQGIVDLIEESPVLEFVCFVFRYPNTSKCFLKGFDKFCCTSKNPTLLTKIQKTLDLCHVSQTGIAIKYLVNTWMLEHRQTAVARMASTLATRKLELLLTFESDEVKKQLSQDEICLIKSNLALKNLDKKYETLVSLLNKILVRFYDFAPLDFEQKSIDTRSIRNLQIDQTWYLELMQSKKCDLNLKKHLALSMSGLEYNEIFKILTGGEQNSVASTFGTSLIGDCLEVGTNFAKNKNLQDEPAILKAPIEVLFVEIDDIILHAKMDKENGYPKLFHDHDFNIQATNLVSSLTSLMKCLQEIKSLNISEREFLSIFQVTAVLIEFIGYNTTSCSGHYLDVNKLDTYLNCVVEVLSRPEFFSVFATDDNIYWLCTFVNSIHSLTDYLLRNGEPLPLVDMYVLKSVIENDLTKHAGQACHLLYILLHWLYRIEILDTRPSMPEFLFSKVKKIVILLGRIPQFYSYNLVPLKVWKSRWEPELSGKYLTEIPALPMDYLQELDILEEFIFRVTLLGWTSRQQFEETWMSYLSVLCYPLDSVDTMDLSNSIKASSHAVKAITVLLIQTIRDPILGNSSMSKLMHVSRRKSLCNEAMSVKKLRIIQNAIENHIKLKETMDLGLKNIFDETDLEKSSEKYSYGQLSIKYFMVATNSHVWDGCTACETYKKRRKMLEDTGIDVNSCLQFLLDYFTQLVKAESSVTDLGLLHEIVKSIVFISDLFTDKIQFEWMQNTFLDLWKIHSCEDELLHQYLIVGLCKAVAVLCPELEVFEQIKKILIQFLKNPFVPSRTACIYGILYLVEGCLLNNTKIGGVSEETQLLLPSIVEYLQLHLNTTHCVLKRSQEHRLLIWSLAFFLIENIDEIHMETMFVDSTLLTAFEVLRKKTGDCVEKCIIKGLERLLIVRPKYISEKIGKSLYSLALDHLKSDNTTISLVGFQLLLTYMYTDCAEHLEKDPKTQANPDQLVQTIEKTTAIFETVKRSYTLEAEVICAVLPKILDDFFSPSDILTKVIGEFLSTQQPYPKLMSGVVFKVFESAIIQNQLSLLQDWVVFSLSNFTQSFSNMAVWSLTCFFISASQNPWLRASFSYVQTRTGRYEQEDKKMFCIAGLDFYKNLSDAQKKTFVDSFTKAKDYPDTPFSDLLNSL